MKKYLLPLITTLALTTLRGQELKPNKANEVESPKLKVSGYIQAQSQWGEPKASLRIGNTSQTHNEPMHRMGIRRGRVKLSYSTRLIEGVFQVDATERGLGIKDAYLQLKAPWQGWRSSSLKLGIFDRPFGSEITYSSSRRESPERSAIYNGLFPDERDMGLMLSLQAEPTSPLHLLRLDLGLFAGNAISQETDNRKDLIARLSAEKKTKGGLSWVLGASYYHGFRQQNTANIYRITDGRFRLDDAAANLGAYALRQYWGIDGQLSFASPLGRTQLRAEYLAGTQPSTGTSFRSHNSSTPTTGDTYIRSFSGGYAMLVQSLGKLPLSAVVKYDWLDPNTKLSSEQVGLGGSSSADLAQSTLGLGMLWEISSALRLTAYYDLVHNASAPQLKGYESDRADNVFTLRLQYKF